MLDARLDHPTDLAGWRAWARVGMTRGIAPEAIGWRIACDPPELFAAPAATPPADAPPLRVSRRFTSLADDVVCQRHPARFALLYRLLWRICRGERRLLAIATDADVARAEGMARAVRRDVHKMKAFVRFRSVCHDGCERFIAWFEPRHFIVARAAPFFADRFGRMPWSIVTPESSAHWDGARLTFAPGMERAAVPDADALEEAWRRYYAAIFNPARVNLRAMQAQMPARYWQNLPEARLIGPLARGASACVSTAHTTPLEAKARGHGGRETEAAGDPPGDDPAPPAAADHATGASDR